MIRPHVASGNQPWSSVRVTSAPNKCLAPGIMFFFFFFKEACALALVVVHACHVGPIARSYLKVRECNLVVKYLAVLFNILNSILSIQTGRNFSGV